MSVPQCPVHRTPLVTHGEQCPECGGEGTLRPDVGLWDSYCDACRGGGLRYECPACERERDEDEAAREEERYLRYLENR